MFTLCGESMAVYTCTVCTYVDCEWTEEYSSATCEFAMKTYLLIALPPKDASLLLFNIMRFIVILWKLDVSAAIYRLIRYLSFWFVSLTKQKLSMIWRFVFVCVCVYVLSPSHIKMHKTFLRLYINKVVEAFE